MWWSVWVCVCVCVYSIPWTRVPQNTLRYLTSSYKYSRNLFEKNESLVNLVPCPWMQRMGWELESISEALPDSLELALSDIWSYPSARSPLSWFAWKSLSHQVISSFSPLGVIILKGDLFTKLYLPTPWPRMAVTSLQSYPCVYCSPRGRVCLWPWVWSCPSFWQQYHGAC